MWLWRGKLGSWVSVADLCRNSTLRNNNSQSWWHWSYWSVLMTMATVLGMRRALPDAACSGLPPMPLDATSGRVFATYHPNGCHLHQCCCACIAYKTQLLACHIRRKPIVVFRLNGRKWLRWYWQRMFNIQYEDLEVNELEKKRGGQYQGCHKKMILKRNYIFLKSPITRKFLCM